MNMDRDLKILIVDDVTNMRRTIRNMLRNMGFNNLTEAADGEAAVTKIKSQIIDFVITDWRMPKMSGFKLLEEIRNDEDIGTLPVLMVTAEITEGQIAHAAETMVNGYIIKPFVQNVLAKKMDEIWARKLKPSLLETTLKIGEAMVEGGLCEKALEEYNKISLKYPKSARVMEAIAEVHDKMENTNKALDFYTRATELNPLYIKSWQKLADLQSKMGKEEEAVKAMEKAAQISPNDPARQKGIGLLYLKQGNVEKAKEAFGSAVKYSENSSIINMEIGEAFLKAGMADMAADAFRKSLVANPNGMNAYNRLGIALRRRGKFEEAIDEYKKALKIAPNDEVLHYNLAKAYLEAGMRDEAYKAVGEALKFDPDFEEARKFQKTLSNEG